ncbi:heterokaryon incompatibility protein-domain-containing protein, partial [Halenospora varia]
MRLVRLHAGRGKEDLRCELFHSNLNDYPDFEALSYTWGASVFSRRVYSDDGSLNITESCAAALQDLRYSFRDRVLWIDAICINQNDNEEKSQQVPLMNKIYARARRVVIYIGPESRPNIDLFFDYFRREEASTTSRVLQSAASAFLSKPWFSRVWILQEVAVAREALLMWGSETLDWRYFSAARFNALKLMPVDKSGKIPPVLQLAQDERKPLKNFASLMHTARGCLATDPRDKVYALLGLLGGHVRHPLITDYNKSVEILYIEVAMHIIN